MRSQYEPAIGEMDLSGGVARLIGGEIDREPADFLGLAEAPDGLTIDESLTNLVDRLAGVLSQCFDAHVERRRFDRAGTDRVAADSLPDVVDGDRLGEANDCGLARAIDVAIEHAAHRACARCDIDDRAAAVLQHRWKK